MRLYVHHPIDSPLPLTDDDVVGAGLSSDLPAAPLLSPEAVAGFNALLHEINPDAPRVDGTRLRVLCAWLASMPPQDAHDVLARRLQRMEALRAIFEDADWDTDAALQRRLHKLFAYIDLGEDLIPDREPLLGKLDDVLLIELTWPVFADEAEDYRDFCEYRTAENPTGDGQARRNAWIRERMAEISLWQHRLRVHDSRYDGGDPPSPLFRVS